MVENVPNTSSTFTPRTGRHRHGGFHAGRGRHTINPDGLIRKPQMSGVCRMTPAVLRLPATARFRSPAGTAPQDRIAHTSIKDDGGGRGRGRGDETAAEKAASCMGGLCLCPSRHAGHLKLSAVLCRALNRSEARVGGALHGGIHLDEGKLNNRDILPFPALYSFSLRSLPSPGKSIGTRSSPWTSFLSLSDTLQKRNIRFKE